MIGGIADLDGTPCTGVNQERGQLLLVKQQVDFDLEISLRCVRAGVNYGYSQQDFSPLAVGSVATMTAWFINTGYLDFQLLDFTVKTTQKPLLGQPFQLVQNSCGALKHGESCSITFHLFADFPGTSAGSYGYTVAGADGSIEHVSKSISAVVR